MARLVAVILTRDEAHNVDWCVLSVQPWVDAVVVWDSGSTDDTVERARRAGALVVRRPFDNYAAQRQAALDTLDADWILFVDADERVTPELGAEVRALVAADQRVNAEPAAPELSAEARPLVDAAERGAEVRPLVAAALHATAQPADPPAILADLPTTSAADSRPRIDGYWIPRRNFIVGRHVQAGGFSPDYQLRLLRRGHAHYVREREVHEIVQLDGGEARLTHPFIHYNYLTWSQFHRKQAAYSAYEARILVARGIRPRPHNYLLQPLREFRRRYLTLHGHRDGLFGLQLAAWLAYYYGYRPYRLL